MAVHSDILYPRYSDIKEILLASDGIGGNERIQADGEEPEMPETETQITDQKRKISGPGNAEEAQMLREKLGRGIGMNTLVMRTGLSHASPAAGVSSKQPFKFGFSPTERDDDAPQIEDTNGAERSTESGEETKTTEAEAALQERLKRVMGEPSGSTERRVFVGGMPFGYEESDVLDYWSYCGEIESLDLMRFPDTGRFKGIAFITFKTEGGYKAALECDGMTIDTVQIKVEPCISAGPKRKKQRNEVVSQTNRKAHSGAAPKVEGYNVAYVGNIAFEAGESDLRELLAGCEITKVRRHTDKDTGKFKGYAHVHFADEESLDRAMEFDGAALKGRRIRVGYAQEKKPKE